MHRFFGQVGELVGQGGQIELPRVLLNGGLPTPAMSPILSSTATAWSQAATRKAAIALDITSDKLQIQIAKLEHKPENLLKLALDESRLSAYNLTEQLRKSNDEAVPAPWLLNNTSGKPELVPT